MNRNASDVTFFFLDRSVDAVTPLMHAFTYESLLFDFMKVSFEGKENIENKEYYSFEELDDEIYEEFRYKHMSSAL